MDTKIIKTFGQDILCYKLKTAKQKKKLAKKGIEKKLLQLDKERKNLRKAKDELPYIELQEPYQKGWERFFVLRDDVARSNTANFYTNILQKINTVKYCTRKDFKKRKRVKGKKIDVLKIQYTKAFDQSEFDKLNFTEKEAALFSWELIKQWNNKYVKMLVFNEPWRFVLKIAPHIITHAKMVDVKLESEIKEIENFIDRNNLQHKIGKAKSKSYNYKWDYNIKEKYKFKKMCVIDWMNEINI